VWLLSGRLTLSGCCQVTSFFAVVPPSSCEQYRLAFADALDAYLGGPDGSEADWPTAVLRLEACALQCPLDGVVGALLGFMRLQARPDGTHPPEWPGYRVLHDK